VIVRRIHEEHRDDPFISIAANSRPILEDLVGDMRTPLYVLFAATGCLLLIACLNIASLLVARGAARRRELAIRTALGGGRWRLLREHLAESLVLSAVSGGLGLLTAYGILRWFVHARPEMSRVEAIAIDGAAVGFALALVVVCAVFAGLTSSASSISCMAARFWMRCAMARVRRARGRAECGCERRCWRWRLG